MSTPRFLLPVAALLLGLGVVAGSPLSGATFTSTSTTDLGVTAASDWTPPSVTVTNPGPAISGGATIAATATDARGTVASVRIEFAAAGSETWRTLCIDTGAPYSCLWTTTSGSNAVPDGLYDLRAAAIDSVGLRAESDVVQTRVVNDVAVVLAPLEETLRGSVTLQASFVNGLLPANLYFEYAVTGGSWTAVPGCGFNVLVVGPNRSCAWDTSALTGEYDVRAVARTAIATYHDSQLGLLVDNTLPTVTLTVPANPLRGTIVLTAAATDEDSGMASVRFDHRAAGATTWLTCGTDVEEPWRCALNTASLTDGDHELRAVATDVAGNTRTTAIQTRMINNTVSSVSITSPLAADTVRGKVTVTADASSTAGITSVAFEARPVGGTWSPLCDDATPSYSCSWDTSLITGADHELRAILTDGTAATTTSASVPVTVDNRALRALDVQVTNVAASGLPAMGDRITLTYSTLVDPLSIKSGWTGSTTALTVAFNDKNVAGAPLTGADWANLTGVNLGKLSFAQNYVKTKKSSVFAATMVADTQVVGGTSVTTVTITLGTPTNGSGNLRTANVSGITRWFPSTLARTPSGQPSSGSVVAESGTADWDF